MILPDVNLVIHAYNIDSPNHEKAKKWFETTFSGRRPVGLCWVVILAFLRISTHRAVFRTPLFPSEATDIVRSWLKAPCVEVITPGEEHSEVLFRLLEQLGTGGNLTSDAHLAALAIEFQAEIATTDADFARFPGVRWFNPIA